MDTVAVESGRSLVDDRPYMVWRDLDKKRRIRPKAKEAIERYRETRGVAATQMLINPQHLEEIGELEGIEIGARHYVAPFTFYIRGE